MHLTNLVAQSQYYAHATALLTSYGLLTSDLASDSVKLWAAEDNGILVGVIGIEHAGDIGLLRSLAVSKSYQGSGIAKQLCDLVFDYAKTGEVAQIYLLTETAAGFFERMGFREVARETVPDSLRATAQFSALCPESATVMVRG